MMYTQEQVVGFIAEIERLKLETAAQAHATVGWARDEGRLLNPVMSAERRPLPVPPPMELTEAEIIALQDWRENSEERQRLLGKDAKRADR